MKPGKRPSADIRITALRIFRYDIPLRAVFEIATMKISDARNVLIKIETDAGIVGWGEGAPFHALVGETQDICFAAGKAFRDKLTGKNPLEIDELTGFMDAFLPHNTTLKSAIDMALFDIAAQVAGMPLYAFLGGSKGPIETDMTIGLCDPAVAADRALKIKEMGFNKIKVKLGLNDAEDFRRMKLIREAVGDAVCIRIDANQGWDRIAALRNLEALAAFNIEFCEQPCRVEDIDATRYVSATSKIPVMADESLFSPYEALALIRNNVVPYFNIKLSKSGGIHNALKIAHVAEAGAIPCMIGCMSETRLGITAAAHFGLSSSIIRFYDLDSHLEHAIDPVEGGISMQGGLIELPDAPGIGACPDPAFVDKLEEIHE